MAIVTPGIDIHHPPSAQRIINDAFEYHPAAIWHGVREGRGKAIIEVGIYLLVLTPITRVFMSFVVFAIEHDWLYALITLVFLPLTLAGLLSLH